MKRNLSAVRFRPVPDNDVWGGRSLRGVADGATNASRQGFEQWLRKAYPKFYAAVMKQSRPASGLGQTEDSSGGWFSKLTGALTNLAPTYLQYQAQKDIIDVQLDRARQGLPPIDTGAFAPQVQVSLDPETLRQAARDASGAAGATFSAMMSNPLTWLVLGGGTLLLLSQRRRRRRA